MTNHDKLIPEYQAAIRAVREGRFDSPIPVDDNNEVGKLSHDLNELARELERKFDEAIKMRKISAKITAGLFLDDVLCVGCRAWLTLIRTSPCCLCAFTGARFPPALE